MITRKGRWLFVVGALVFVLGVPPIGRAAKHPAPPQSQTSTLPSVKPSNGDGMNVLILGDSLALCGFGKRLDEKFRADPRVRSAFTYMACGTNPLSWLKQKPYTSIKALCGYWSIESAANAKPPREMQDTYGMEHGHAPKPHPVPKLEDLLSALHPDILVVQTGSNLFGLFPDAKTVRPAQNAAALRSYLLPFKDIAVGPNSTLRKIYWLSPPTSGRVSKEVQDFLFEETRKELGAWGTVIDSRLLVSYPYKHMDPDKEHFLGDDMNLWADNVFNIIQRDLAAQPLASLKPFAERGEVSLVAQPVVPEETPGRAEAVTPAETPARAEAVVRPALAAAQVVPQIAPQKKEPVLLKATLVFKSEPIPLNELMPYQESLVAYVYEVEKVLKGHYEERQILVMHPAHIALKPQKLKYKIGKHYKLRLDRMEGTLWETAKAKDESGQINLLPYMQVEDLRKHPGNRTR